MEVELLFKIAGVGIIVSILNQILSKSGREEQAMIVTITGLIIVLMMVVSQVSSLFNAVKSAFGF